MKSGDVFKGSFLKADDLAGRTVKVTIESVSMEDIGEDRRAVAHFVGKDKGLVLNKTNWNTLEEVCDSKDSDDWAGVVITLYVAKVDYQGKRVPALRISDQPGSFSKPAKAVAPDIDDDPQDTFNADDIPF